MNVKNFSGKRSPEANKNGLLSDIFRLLCWLILIMGGCFLLLSFIHIHQEKKAQLALNKTIATIFASQKIKPDFSGSQHVQMINNDKIENELAFIHISTYRNEFAEKMKLPLLSAKDQPGKGLFFITFYITQAPRTPLKPYVSHLCHFLGLFDQHLPFAYPGTGSAGGNAVWPDLSGDYLNPLRQTFHFALPAPEAKRITQFRSTEGLPIMLVSEYFDFPANMHNQYFGQAYFNYFQRDYLPHISLIDMTFPCGQVYQLFSKQNLHGMKILISKKGIPDFHTANIYDAAYYLGFNLPHAFIDTVMPAMTIAAQIDINNTMLHYRQPFPAHR